MCVCVCVCERERDSRVVHDGLPYSSSLLHLNTYHHTRVSINHPSILSSLCHQDHGPESPEEYKRVQQLPMEEFPQKLLFVYDKVDVLRKYECPQVFLESGEKDPKFVKSPWALGLHPTNVRYEPAVYAVTPRSISKDTTCIAMTRALGDFYAHQFGLTYKPSIVIKRIPPKMSFSLAIGSDGVWDCWKYEDFLAQFNKKIFSEGQAFEVAVEQIMTETLQRAVSSFGPKNVDDTTLICILCTDS